MKLKDLDDLDLSFTQEMLLIISYVTVGLFALAVLVIVATEVSPLIFLLIPAAALRYILKHGIE
jgi:hypothetical protein